MNINEEDLKLFNNGFIENNDYKFVEYKDNQLIVEAKLNDYSLNPYKIAHGGFIYGLMDTCAGLHILLETNKKAVTISSSINYVKACKGSKLIAKSKPIKIGKNICIIDVYAYNDKDEIVTTGTFNFYFID